MYAKVVKKKVSEDMRRLRQILMAKSPVNLLWKFRRSDYIRKEPILLLKGEMGFLFAPQSTPSFT
jgi:hypothetical protein